ncbi:MAG TPA: transglycosylase SLT domain-containing protein [Luteimonas sp.]|nr:transglycosylase SLT domain-containing protein [Luteimonas sp.]
MRRPAARRLVAALVAALALGGAHADEPAQATATPAAQPAPAASPVPATRNGREIYARFREGLADPSCGPDTSARWQRHFAAAPKKLAAPDTDVLPLFGYVVDALREANLPTEYALIPFVESGYKPGVRSGSGPAGLWQFIALTARNHEIPIRAGYDGRLSPVESTRAAVRYLKTLHGMFAGDWRLAVMAYNAGEYRVLGALKRSGQRAMDADPEKLVGLSGITRAYVRKLHALSCVLDQADDREEWKRALDRPVAVLRPATLPAGTVSLDTWARQHRLDPARVKQINPAFAGGQVARGKRPAQVLAPVPAPATTTLADAADAIVIEPAATQPVASAAASADPAPVATPRTHVVQRGDSIWRLAERYDVRRADLLERNGLSASDMLRPGMVLAIDPAPASASVQAAGGAQAMPE